ncbi:DUF2378 family protein [Archangium sp.]|uniref:DUF2378 family protein n=1 Tax=Archangium sp. TaxID=1872627 RepID=UPI002D3E60A1|nr:DUF2378 family protein [Archangium sp.]HYO54256.1 DUF2378 family protein [Archangium sp.]
MSTSRCGVEADQGTRDLPEEWEERMALATPADTVRGMFFLDMLEAVRALEGEEGVRQCVGAGGEPRFVEFFNYPVGTWLRVNDAAARVLGPRCGGWEEAQRQLGRRAMADMLKSAAGKALLLLSRGETRRLVSNLPSVYRAAVNFGERTVIWEGPTRGRVVMRRDFMPCAYHEGVLLGGLEGLKARAVSVRGSRMEVLDSEYLLSWE